jgi:hypothetical protein
LGSKEDDFVFAVRRVVREPASKREFSIARRKAHTKQGKKRKEKGDYDSLDSRKSAAGGGCRRQFDVAKGKRKKRNEMRQLGISTMEETSKILA